MVTFEINAAPSPSLPTFLLRRTWTKSRQMGEMAKFARARFGKTTANCSTSFCHFHLILSASWPQRPLIIRLLHSHGEWGSALYTLGNQGKMLARGGRLSNLLRLICCFHVYVYYVLYRPFLGEGKFVKCDLADTNFASEKLKIFFRKMFCPWKFSWVEMDLISMHFLRILQWWGKTAKGTILVALP
jgi:hypothetical protein